MSEHSPHEHEHEHGHARGHGHGHDHPGLAVEVERTGPCTASVRFSVTPEEFQRARRTGLQNLARQTKLKGFRPGKAPVAMLEKRFGKEVEREVVQHFVQHAFDQAVQREDLRPAASPRIELGDVHPAPGEAWEHDFEILLRPTIELGQVEGITIDGQKVEVTDEEIDGALADLRREHSRPEPVGNEGLPEDGMALGRLELFVEDRDEPLLDREGFRLAPKNPPPGVDAEAFEEALLGAKKGEVRELPAAFPDDFPAEEARGKSGRCRITLTDVVRIVPPSDEELFTAFDVEDTDGLRNTLSGKIREYKEEAERRRLESALIERLLENHPMEVPEPLVEDQVEARIREFKKGLESQGLPDEEIETLVQNEEPRARQASGQALRALYLMEEIARTKDLEVTREDLEAELAAIAIRNRATVEEVRKVYQEEGLVRQLAMELLERKVRSFLRETADIQIV